MIRWIPAFSQIHLRQRPVVAVLALVISVCWASTAWSADHKKKSSRVIDFEDEVVEGMNQRPLDSLSEVAERGRKKHHPHLYRKRVGFKTELRQTLHELRYTQ